MESPTGAGKDVVNTAIYAQAGNLIGLLSGEHEFQQVVASVGLCKGSGYPSCICDQDRNPGSENFCQGDYMNDGYENVLYEGKLLAVIIYDSFDAPGVRFFTPDELSQQVAHMSHSNGKVIDAHVHNPVPREVIYTQEALFIKSGKLRVDFYSDGREYLESRVLGAGDVILLVSGGHGFEVLEDLRMIEVKQGPYTDDKDKQRFAAVSAEKIVVKTTS